MISRHAHSALQSALEEALLPRLVTAKPMSGGCIHRVYDLALRDGTHVAAKVNDASARQMLDEEATSLSALRATRTVHVPQVLGVSVHDDTVVLLTSFIHQHTPRDQQQMWHRFGEDLARLHTSDLTEALSCGYGFPADNHVGSTPQRNAWRDDWVTFNAENRLGPQARLARSRNLLTMDEMHAVTVVINGLDRILPRQPTPSLLHGDLWSGNVLTGVSIQDAESCAVIDPACSVGDALADIAMMRLFGGFPASCFDAWSRCTNLEMATDEAVHRILVYQLYHVLNHINIFGRGYVAQAMGLVDELRALRLDRLG